jgi:hypothetical protein
MIVAVVCDIISLWLQVTSKDFDFFDFQQEQQEVLTAHSYILTTFITSYTLLAYPHHDTRPLNEETTPGSTPAS